MISIDNYGSNVYRSGLVDTNSYSVGFAILFSHRVFKNRAKIGDSRPDFKNLNLAPFVYSALRVKQQQQLTASSINETGRMK